ncbi:amidohydrolase family protein [candidate division KSB1 bacterium]
MNFDTLIINGTVVDGTGGAEIKADIGIKGGIIKAMGDLAGSETGRTIDAAGLVVSPGFIDLHTHADIALITEPDLPPTIRQGVTTVGCSSCGIGFAPLSAETVPDMVKWWGSIFPGSESLQSQWSGVEEYLGLIDGAVAPNVAFMVPHGAIRAGITGFTDRPADEDEINKMNAWLEKIMAAGIFGLSTSPFYAPMREATREEFTSLATVVAAAGGVVTVHIRDYFESIFDHVEEFLTVARDSGASLEISHLQLAAESMWGRSKELLARLEAAVESGIDVHYDLYPYPAGSTFLSSYLPAWCTESDAATTLEFLRDPESRKRIVKEIAESSFPWHRAYPSTIKRNTDLLGIDFRTAANVRGMDLYEFIVELLIEEELDVSFVAFLQDENDLRNFTVHPLHIVASDSLYMKGKPHPRLHGTFPRVLAKLVREEGWFSLSEAVRQMTGAPAAKLGLRDRGTVQKGLAADITVFDPEKIVDKATFEKPAVFPEGIGWVLVNGEAVVAEGKPTGVRPGRVLRK